MALDFENEDLHKLDLDRLMLADLTLKRLEEIALSRNLISALQERDEGVDIFLGRLRLTFSREEAHLYLRGLIRGHLKTLKEGGDT